VSDTHPEVYISGGVLRSDLGYRPYSRGALGEAIGVDSCSLVERSQSRKGFVQNSGSTDFFTRSGSVGPTSDTFERSLVGQTCVVNHDSAVGPLQGSASMVAAGGLGDQSGVSIKPFSPSVLIFTDASNMGWGAHVGDKMLSGTWSLSEHVLHINCLELLAVTRAVQEAIPVMSGHQGPVGDGQHHSCVLYKETGRDTLSDTVSASRGAPLSSAGQSGQPPIVQGP
jgi:hypothetical protein